MLRSRLSDLIYWKNKTERKPLVLWGARQVGKTYLLKEFGQKEFPNVHVLNFEEYPTATKIFDKDLNPARILNEIQLFLDGLIHPETDLLIFDEIQHAPNALTSLKYFYEKMPQMAVCAAGSLLGVGLSGESFPVGKVTFLDLCPMNFEEFLLGSGNEQLLNYLKNHSRTEPLPEWLHNRVWELWKHYLITGGLPEVVDTYRQFQDNLYLAFQKVRDVQHDLLDTYMADIAKHSGKINAMHIERLWRNVPAQLARTQDGSAPKFKFKDAIPGFRGYEQLSAPMNWLEKAGLILKTSIIHTAERPLSGQMAENRFKLYLFDVGLLGAMNRLSPAVLYNMEFGRYKGYIAENFVAQELVSMGIKELFCWEGRTSEIEFLLDTLQGIIPVEVKSGINTKAKSLKVFEDRYHPGKSIVLSSRNVHIAGKRYYLPVYLTMGIDK